MHCPTLPKTHSLTLFLNFLFSSLIISSMPSAIFQENNSFRRISTLLMVNHNETNSFVNSILFGTSFKIPIRFCEKYDVVYKQRQAAYLRTHWDKFRLIRLESIYLDFIYAAKSSSLYSDNFFATVYCENLVSIVSFFHPGLFFSVHHYDNPPINSS